MFGDKISVTSAHIDDKMLRNLERAPVSYNEQQSAFQ
jgi:hypothetical protein